MKNIKEISSLFLDPDKETSKIFALLVQFGPLQTQLKQNKMTNEENIDFFAKALVKSQEFESASYFCLPEMGAFHLATYSQVPAVKRLGPDGPRVQ